MLGFDFKRWRLWHTHTHAQTHAHMRTHTHIPFHWQSDGQMRSSEQASILQENYKAFHRGTGLDHHGVGEGCVQEQVDSGPFQ